jgi:CelD/BcsL family acetyltransferase involved in cellulose biosynthesis
LSKRNNPKFSLLLDHLSSDVVTTTEGLESIKGQWEALFKSAGDVTVFQSFAWNYAWWKAFGARHNLFVLVVYEKDELVGLAPFVIKHRLGVPEVEPIGKDQYAYFGLLAKDNREDVIEALAQRLCDSCPVGLVHFPYHAVSNRGVNVLGGALSDRGWREARWRRNVSHWVCADNGFEGYVSGKSQKARYNLRRERKKLEEQNRVAVARYLGPAVDEKVIHRMRDIQQRSWLSRRGTDFVDAPALKAIINGLGDAGMVDVFLMTFDEKDVAFILNFRSGVSGYCFAIAFDEALDSLSPGKVLMNICIQTLLDEGVKIYDFLFGDAEYKRFWSNRTSLVFRSVFFRGPRSRVLSWFPHRLHGTLAQYQILKKLLAKGRGFRRRFLTKQADLPNASVDR